MPEPNCRMLCEPRRKLSCTHPRAGGQLTRVAKSRSSLRATTLTGDAIVRAQPSGAMDITNLAICRAHDRNAECMQSLDGNVHPLQVTCRSTHMVATASISHLQHDDTQR